MRLFFLRKSNKLYKKKTIGQLLHSSTRNCSLQGKPAVMSCMRQIKYNNQVKIMYNYQNIYTPLRFEERDIK